MSNGRYIEIQIDIKGNALIEAIGFQGNTCESATAPFEDALGTVESRERKPEFYNEESTAEENRIRSRF